MDLMRHQKEKLARTIATVRKLAAANALDLNNYDAAYHYSSQLLKRTDANPHSVQRILKIFNSAVNGMQHPSKAIRWLERKLNKEAKRRTESEVAPVESATSDQLHFILGHLLLQRQGYQNAFNHYKVAYHNGHDNDPNVNLSMGIAKLQDSLKKGQKEKHHSIISAFAFFFKYLALRNNDAESNYNVGRAFHYIGIMHMAKYYYEKSLQRANEGDNCVQQPSAHNLARIYVSSGAPELARRLYREYCCAKFNKS